MEEEGEGWGGGGGGGRGLRKVEQPFVHVTIVRVCIGSLLLLINCNIIIIATL